MPKFVQPSFLEMVEQRQEDTMGWGEAALDFGKGPKEVP